MRGDNVVFGLTDPFRLSLRTGGGDVVDTDVAREALTLRTHDRTTPVLPQNGA
jgi:hypothetical protein